MGAWKRRGVIEPFRQKLRDGMVARGIPAGFADRLYEQIRGFAEYGFPESHAASFAVLTYISAWLKCHFPAAFAAALLNSQPMGFYAPAQLIRDAQTHGVVVLPVDVNHSEVDCTLESASAGKALRLGFRLGGGNGVGCQAHRRLRKGVRGTHGCGSNRVLPIQSARICLIAPK